MKEIIAGATFVAMIAIPADATSLPQITVPTSQFASAQLHEPFTLVYHAAGPLMPDGPSESTVTISASNGRLLYYQQSDNDPRITVAIYDGHETYSIGDKETTIESGFCFDRFYTMPLPAVGLPYLPIARTAHDWNHKPGPKTPIQLRPVFERAWEQFTKLRNSSDQAVTLLHGDSKAQQDVETIAALGFRDSNSGPSPTSAVYGIAAVGWAKGLPPKMLWLVAPQNDMNPLYLWIYRKHVLFQGFNLASDIHFTHFPGSHFDKRVDCNLKLTSMDNTPLPDQDYYLENYIPVQGGASGGYSVNGYTRIDDYTSGSDIGFEYASGNGSLQQQYTKSELLQSRIGKGAYSHKAGSKSSTGITLVLAMIFGTAVWLLYKAKLRKA